MSVTVTGQQNRKRHMSNEQSRYRAGINHGSFFAQVIKY